MSQLRFAAGLSTRLDLSAALDEICVAVKGLQPSIDLAMVFVSQDRANDCQRIADALCDRLGTEHLLGCTAESLVGTGREVEGETGISLWAAHLPRVLITPM